MRLLILNICSTDSLKSRRDNERSSSSRLDVVAFVAVRRVGPDAVVAVVVVVVVVVVNVPVSMKRRIKCSM